MNQSRIGLAVLPLLLAQNAAFAQDSGIYVRGDVGYAWSRDTGFVDKDAPNILVSGPNAEIKGDFDSSFVGTIGVGYRFNDFVRSDATVSYLPNFSFSGADFQNRRAEVDASSWVGMVSGYVDTGSLLGLGSFNPYFGGGIGISRNRLSTVTSTSNVAGGLLVADTPGKTKNNFAWMLTAGIAVDIMPSVTLDAGYKYLDLGNVESGGNASISVGGGAPFSRYINTVEADLQAHVVSVGIRYSF
jgi:opacity protein-like surface antigen